MKLLKQFIVLLTIGLLIGACGSSPVKSNSAQKEEPVVIANDSLEYEIIIIDPGFNLYLNTVARPEGFYSQNYMENQNRMFVTIWNNRAQNPQLFNPNIYETNIDYDPNIDYGYEVNYKLFNYFLFAQQKYKMSLNIGRHNRTN